MIKLLLILLLSTISLAIGAMGMGLGSKLVLFSEVNGQVVDQGKPVAGAIVTRYYRWSWLNREATDQTVTDNEGRFSFKSVNTRSITALFPHQPYISQKLEIHIGKKVYEAWRTGKMNYDSNGELQGKPIDIICELDKEPEWKNDVFGISRILSGRVYGTINP